MMSIRNDTWTNSWPQRKGLKLVWRAGERGRDFRQVALGDPSLREGGVYVIHRHGKAVRLGQATRLRDRLRAHQDDVRVVGATSEALAVVWAFVPRAYRDGVEAFLGRALRPDVAERFPDVPHIHVNLPDELVTAGFSADGTVRAEVVDIAYRPRPEKKAMHNRSESIANDEPTSQTNLLEAIEVISFLHGKDAKNSRHHDEDECGMCAALERIAPIMDGIRAVERRVAG